MAKVSKSTYGPRPGSAPYAPVSPSNWVQTPRWHWRYWIGHRMRHYVYTGWAPPEVTNWEYRTFGQHARAVLEEQANGCYNQGGEAQAQRSPNYITGYSSGDFPEAH